VKCTVYASFRPSTAGSRWVTVKWRHLQVTFGHLRSRDVISCHVTESCELQPCRKWNVQYTPFSASQSLFQVTSAQMISLPGHFRSPVVTWRHFVTWLPPPASYSLVGSEMFSICQFSAFHSRFQVTYSEMTSLPVTWGHVTSFPDKWLSPHASYSLVGSEMYSIRKFSAFHWHFQVTSGQMTSLPGHFQSPEFTWRHFLSRDCLLRATAL